MSKRSRSNRSKAHRGKAGRGTARRGGATSSSRRRGPGRHGDEPDLMDGVAAALADDDPLPLLGLASSVLAVFDPRRRPLSPSRLAPELPPRDELLQTFFDVDVVETSALLAAIGVLAGDEVLHRRVRREIAARGHVLPHWLVELGQAQLTDRVVGMGHVLGDGDNIMLGVRLPGGPEISIVVYIDHNMGSLVKDAFVVPDGLPALVELMHTAADDPDTTFTDLDPADARVRITEAIELGAITFPPLESDTWPGCRPLVEWATRMLPDGGTGYQRPEWSDDARQALVERFLASPFGAGLDDADRRGLLDAFLWFGTDYGPGDPLRWSSVAVEILLVDWIPRKIVAEVPYLTLAPELLRAFIRFSHHERGIRAQLTADTLAAVDLHEPEYQEIIRSPRPQGPAALLAAMGALDPDGPWATVDDALVDLDEIMLDGLVRAVGGPAALDTLDDRPLPDEPFAWQQVPADVHERVSDVLTLVDRGCDEMFDEEFRTAARRLLAAVAAGDPEIFRRRGRADTAAATTCWIIGKANDAFEGDGPTVKGLLAHFGVGPSTPGQRGKAMLQALGVAPYTYGGIDLGSPAYLTSARRAVIIAARDHYREGRTHPG